VLRWAPTRKGVAGSLEKAGWVAHPGPDRAERRRARTGKTTLPEGRRRQ
jgi:hypothetical protein